MASTPTTAGAPQPAVPRRPNLFSLLGPYAPLIAALVALTILGNGLNLLVPRLIGRAIDGYSEQRPILTGLVLELLFVALGIFFFSYLQNVTQTYASERVARDL